MLSTGREESRTPSAESECEKEELGSRKAENTDIVEGRVGKKEVRHFIVSIRFISTAPDAPSFSHE